MKTKSNFPIQLLAGVILILFTGGCSLPSSAGGTSVWLDVPVDGLSFPSVQPIKIEGHAASPGGVNRVEVWINGALLTTINDPPVEGDLAAFHTAWTPPGPGEYTIQAVAFSADETAGTPDSARVTFGDTPPLSSCPTPIGGGPTPVSCISEVSSCPTPVGGGPTPVSCVTPVITDTPTSPPGAVIQFWADPAEIEAGACTTIRWHVENVQRVIFGGVDQHFDGSYEDCLCENQRYSLGIVYLDGSNEKRAVDIAVNGSCVTPTSPPLPEDTTPPPTPSPAVPADGLPIACKGSQSLVWLPVEDPSGIAEYQVEVQRHSGNNKWQDAPGGQISVGGKTTNISVECGWYYRWRVRALDGAGNTSGWSGWSQFAIALT